MLTGLALLDENAPFGAAAPFLVLSGAGLARRGRRTALSSPATVSITTWLSRDRRASVTMVLYELRVEQRAHTRSATNHAPVWL